MGKLKSTSELKTVN